LLIAEAIGRVEVVERGRGSATVGRFSVFRKTGHRRKGALGTAAVSDFLFIYIGTEVPRSGPGKVEIRYKHGIFGFRQGHKPKVVQRTGTAAANDDVVVQGDVMEVKRGHEPFSYENVAVRWLSEAGQMVVGQENAPCVKQQGILYDVAYGDQ